MSAVIAFCIIAFVLIAVIFLAFAYIMHAFLIWKNNRKYPTLGLGPIGSKYQNYIFKPAGWVFHENIETLILTGESEILLKCELLHRWVYYIKVIVCPCRWPGLKRQALRITQKKTFIDEFPRQSMMHYCGAHDMTVTSKSYGDVKAGLEDTDEVRSSSSYLTCYYNAKMWIPYDKERGIGEICFGQTTMIRSSCTIYKFTPTEIVKVALVIHGLGGNSFVPYVLNFVKSIASQYDEVWSMNLIGAMDKECGLRLRSKLQQKHGETRRVPASRKSVCNGLRIRSAGDGGCFRCIDRGNNADDIYHQSGSKIVHVYSFESLDNIISVLDAMIELFGTMQLQISCIGFSLSGNLLLRLARFLSDTAKYAPYIHSIMAVSPPLDVPATMQRISSSTSLTSLFSKVYRNSVLQNNKRLLRSKLGDAVYEKLESCHDIRKMFTLLFGQENDFTKFSVDVNDLCTQPTKFPILILAALNDPLCLNEPFYHELRLRQSSHLVTNPNFNVIMTYYGSHIGWSQSPRRDEQLTDPPLYTRIFDDAFLTS